MILRVVLSLFGAIGIAFGIFWVLQRLIHTDQDGLIHQDTIRVIDFVRLERENELQKKERIKPQKPKPLPTPQPKTEVKQKNIPNKIVKTEPMKLNLDIPLDIAAKGMLGDAIVGRELGSGVVNTNVIPLSRVNPIYPRRAKVKKIEGYVQVEFTITKTGSVKAIEVVKSYPEGVFESSAKRALKQWTFKPKIQTGEAVSQRAGLTINFRLN